MLHELKVKDYSKVANLFKKLKTNAAIESIFNLKNEARLFVDNLENPESVFIINSWAYYYLAGNSENESFNTSLVSFLEDTYFPECIKNNKNLNFAFYPDSDAWYEKVQKMFPNLKLTKSGKTYFIYEKSRFNKNWQKSIPVGFTVKKISNELISSIKNNNEFIEYIECFWGSVDKYFEKGLGYCAVNSSDFATICISVFASENEREVGIKTFPEFQRKGLAYVTACAYIEECINNNYIPIWSCFSENEDSVKLAEKLGYSIAASHPIFFASIGDNVS